jgi:hypothetical protein
MNRGLPYEQVCRRGGRAARHALFWLGVLSLFSVLAATPAPTTAGYPLEPELADAVAGRVAEIRNLSVAPQVPVVVVSRTELAPLIAEGMAASPAPAVRQKLWRLLGRIGEGVDLAHVEAEYLTRYVRAMYDPQRKRIVLVDDLASRTSTKLALAHEMTHAIVDAQVGLDRLMTRVAGNSDRTLAVRVFAEGDAAMTTELFAWRALSRAELAELQDFDVPVLSAGAGGSPGALFAHYLLLTGGWDAINAAYAEPPHSTAQVLHPEKYASGQQPDFPPMANAAAILGAPWVLVHEDTLGELELQRDLGAYMPSFVALPAATGWRGDRYQLLERSDNGSLALVLRLVWETSTDASEFFAAYAGLVEISHEARAVSAQQGLDRKVWTSPDWWIWLERSADQVVLVVAPELEEARKLARSRG